MQIRRLIQPTLLIHHHHPISNNCIYNTRRLYRNTPTNLNMGGRYGRGGRGSGRGRGGRSGGGRGGGGYDWKKHIRPSSDPVVQVSPR